GRAGRPWDTGREGFVPAHGGGVLVAESLSSARRRGARIYAEVLGVEANSDGSHLPQPSEDGQARLMKRLLDRCGLAPEAVDYVSAHPTATPIRALAESPSIKRVVRPPGPPLKLH